MAKKAILSGVIVGKTVSAEFKNNERVGEKFHIKIADIEKNKFTGQDGTLFETNPVSFYDVKVSREQFLSADEKTEMKLFKEIEIEAFEFTIKDNKGGADKIYYRAFDVEDDAE